MCLVLEAGAVVCVSRAGGEMGLQARLGCTHIDRGLCEWGMLDGALGREGFAFGTSGVEFGTAWSSIWDVRGCIWDVRGCIWDVRGYTSGAAGLRRGVIAVNCASSGWSAGPGVAPFVTLGIVPRLARATPRLSVLWT